MLDRLGCRFHHLGIACSRIDAEAVPWLALGYTPEGADFQDPIQQVHGRFLVGPGPRLELLAPLGPDAPIARTIARGTKIYHQAFTAENFGRTIAAFQELGYKRTAGPVSAVGFGGRRIAFFLLANMNLVEIIEAESAA